MADNITLSGNAPPPWAVYHWSAGTGTLKLARTLAVVEGGRWTVDVPYDADCRFVYQCPDAAIKDPASLSEALRDGFAEEYEYHTPPEGGPTLMIVDPLNGKAPCAADSGAMSPGSLDQFDT